MNRFLLIAILSLIASITNAQTYDFTLNADVKKEYRNFKYKNTMPPLQGKSGLNFGRLSLLA